ncbi:hypothetical protein Ancab_018934 [Ancistrocladus abbreviatus]
MVHSDVIGVSIRSENIWHVSYAYTFDWLGLLISCLLRGILYLELREIARCAIEAWMMFDRLYATVAKPLTRCKLKTVRPDVVFPVHFGRVWKFFS